MSTEQRLPVTREMLPTLPKERLSVPSLFKPTVWRVDTPDASYIVKDAAGVPRAYAWIARWQLRRERRGLERVADMPETPTLIGSLDRDAFVQTMMPGRPLDRETFQRAPRQLAEGINELARRVHEHGVFHLDLHARGNILVDESGGLSLVDFGASVTLGSIGRALFGKTLAWIDSQAHLKYLARYSPEELSEKEVRIVLRQRRLRRLWFFTPTSRTAVDRARQQLREAGRQNGAAR